MITSKTQDSRSQTGEADISLVVSPQYVVMTANTTLTNERVLTAGTHITLTDGGAGSTATVEVNLSGNFSWTGTHSFNQDIQLDANLDFVGAQSITTTADNLTLAPAGDIVINPTGNDVLPTTNYDINLGSINKKYLTLHAAELWVETLVAQDTMATIGGRILVGPTTTLTSDLGDGAGDTTIYTEHNNLANGDRVVMEANGKLEWMAITSAAGGAGPYSYSVTRNLDGTGRNLWYAGDAVFNTGTTGDGFIDLYSLAGVIPGSTAGPTIVGMVRTGTTYNDIEARWAIGNLNGWYGVGSNTYGSAFGDYSGGNYMLTDADGLQLYGGDGVVLIDTDGVTIALSSAWAADRSYSFNVSGTNVGGVGGYTNASYNALEGKSISTNKGAIVRLAAETTASYSSQILLQAQGADTCTVKIMGTSSEAGVGISDALAVGSTIYGNITYNAGEIAYEDTLISYKGGANYTVYAFHPLTTPFTNSGFAGGSFSDVSSSTIIQNTAWSSTIPADAKALLIQVIARDSTTWGTSGLYVSVGPSSTYWNALSVRPAGGDVWIENTGPVPCTNGDIYYRVNASGSSTTEIYLYCWGYWI